MATLQDFRNERLRKIEELRKLGVNPYPAKTTRSHGSGDVAVQFETLRGQTVTVAGRIMGIRKFGKIAFIVVRDMTGSVQLFLKEDTLQPLDATNSQLGLEQLNLLDTGDFIEATGVVIKTQTGEVSVETTNLRLLTKALRPMPTALEGFTNKEERLRRRYVDMNVNNEVFERFVRRSRFWQATRDFLNHEGFLEVNVPVLEHTTGGADANPFVTHMDALGQDFYLRISHELPLKRLIGGGYEKVYDIGPRFRNENYSDEHLPEHVAMEWYWAYADWQQGMEFMERMLRDVLQKSFGTLQFKLRNFEVDMSKPWEKWDYAQVIKDHYGLDVFNCTIDEVKKALADNGLEVEKADNKARGIDKLWKKIRAGVTGPVWLINTPTFVSPLSKASDENPAYVQRFQAVIAGSELCNGWSELNDPVDQLNRFLEQQAMRESGDDEAQMLDIDYVEMLEYGMPPTCGLGYSERLFWIFEGVTAREGVPFPQLRQELDNVTKAIYPQVKLDEPVDVETAKTAAKTDAPVSGATLESAAELPLSAAELGTTKLYLDDYQLTEFAATITAVEDGEDGQTVLQLDQTAFYPGGGGQACDTGTISWQGGQLVLSSVKKDRDGIVAHEGVLEGDKPAVGTKVAGMIDTDKRQLHSRLHSAGHLVDWAVNSVGLTAWEPGRGAHYPDMSFVEYKGELNPEQTEVLRQQIESALNNYIKQGGGVSGSRVTPAEARQRSKYIPEVILKMYRLIHLATYPQGFDICCGGTHVADVSQIGTVQITKLKKKDGNIRVSYALVDEPAQQ